MCLAVIFFKHFFLQESIRIQSYSVSIKSQEKKIQLLSKSAISQFVISKINV